MTAAKKLQSTLAGSAGESVYVDDVFSTYLYTGNGTAGSSRTITNGINLADEGGLVWIKDRTVANGHRLTDTNAVSANELYFALQSLTSNGTNAYLNYQDGVTGWTTDGFTMEDRSGAGWGGGYNNSGNDYASWTFRKAPGFFDVVTYTGDGTAGRTVSHNLGCDVGMLIVKCVSGGNWWAVWHRGDSDGFGVLNGTDAFGDTSSGYAGYTTQLLFGDGTNVVTPTSTNFTIGSHSPVNQSGQTYVAYLFADGDDAAAQIFGTDGDQAIVKCGSYTGDDSTDGSNHIDLGFEPQWLLVKCSTNAEDWLMYDNMRGVVNNGYDAQLEANTSDAETTPSYNFLRFTSTGFAPETGDTKINEPGRTYIYIAIRRPHKPAETGSEVFGISTAQAGPPWWPSNFPVDMAFWNNVDGVSVTQLGSRLQGGNILVTPYADAEEALSSVTWDYQDGFFDNDWADTTRYAWMFKRSPGFFDVVCYTDDGTTKNISHNLGVTPELVIHKHRDLSANWTVFHKDMDDQTASPSRDWWEYGGNLNLSAAFSTKNNNALDLIPSDTTYPVEGGWTNVSGYNSIMYLFASQDGISKVGSYTGNGTSINIDCGFESGARFVLIKRTNDTGHWYVFDTERGIVAGNDSKLMLNLTNAEITSTDEIDPYSSGFTINNDADTLNKSGDTYIYLAIA